MATIQKRSNGTFRAQVRKLGAYLSKSFDTEEEAQLWAATTEARLVAGLDAPGAVITLSTPVRSIINKYAREISPTKKGARTEQQCLGALVERYSVFDKPVCQFSSKDIEAVMASRAAGNVERKWKACKPGTIIRELGALSAVFGHAIKKWNAPWDQNPVHAVSRPKAPAPRFARISESEIDIACAWLGYTRGTSPQTAKQLVAWALCFAVATTCRRGEILALDWAHVDYSACELVLDDTKNGERFRKPMFEEAEELLRLLPQGIGAVKLIWLSSSYFGNLWQMCRKATGIKFTFHDSRHEGTTRAARDLSNVLELQRVTGHKDLRSLAIYFNPTSAELRDKVRKSREQRAAA
ncbi:tyrosine-type recombinase/integrase [Paraburkholderia nemoris]|uniref:tyrosine-type recombinase/integrase n=1 Tax=Paraburkholderia nemoris TaxID=2793076 RepID=UPI0038B85A84